MRAVIQRVKRASVKVEGELTGSIEAGLLVLLGVGPRDTEQDVAWMLRKITTLRIFPDAAGKMNLDLIETGGDLLVVSQFTLYGDCRKGRRPSFVGAAPPALAEDLVDKFVDLARAQGLHCETGRFQADMDVELLNQGPVTMLIDSEKTF